MARPNLPTNIDASYPDGTDPSVVLHQRHHDQVHTITNLLDSVTGTALEVVSSQSGNSYSISLIDEGKMLESTSAYSLKVIVPTDSSVNFPIGSRVKFRQIGAGQIGITPATGVTITSLNNVFGSAGAYGEMVLTKRAANTWTLSGAIATFTLVLPPTTGGTSGTTTFKGGANLHVMYDQDATIDQMIAQCNALGLKSMRIDIDWSNYEKYGKGQYNATYLERLNRFINGVTGEVRIVVTRCPFWANGQVLGDGAGMLVPPTNPVDMADFIAYLMTTFAGRVHSYEIWNEPNGGWAWANPDPVKWCSLMQTCYTRVKSIDPTVKCVGPSISNTDQAAYLTTCYNNGLATFTDAIPLHFYNDPPSHGSGTPEQLVSTYMTNIQSIINSRDNGREIWIGEMGWNTLSTGGVTEAVQADYLTRLFAAIRSSIPNCTRAEWYELHDEGVLTDTTSAENHYGVVSNDYTYQKPSWAALKTACT